MKFTCCLNMGFNLTILKMSPDLFVQESFLARTDYCVDVFVHEHVARSVML